MNYDDTVRYTSQLALENGWVLIQDTMWQGYDEIPLWIMQGYTTLVQEIVEQIQQAPTHVFLQAGVGSFAGAVVAFYSNTMSRILHLSWLSHMSLIAIMKALRKIQINLSLLVGRCKL